MFSNLLFNSYYQKSVNFSLACAQLSEHKNTNICIIGGGFTGIVTALELAKMGLNVIVLESLHLGWGASGRNGGQLIRGIGNNISKFRSIIGDTGVKNIEELGYESVNMVRQYIKENNIRCDLSLGYIDVALTKKDWIALKKEYFELQSSPYAHHFNLLNQEELSGYLGSNQYYGGLRDRESGHLHPLNLLLSEAKLAQSIGVEIYEYSQVKDIQYGKKKHLIKTRFGSVESDFIVFAGNAYLQKLEPMISKKILPASSFIIATEPLSKEEANSILPRNHAICDTKIALDYYRLSSDNRLLFGGACYYTGRRPENIEKIMVKKMLQVFPQLYDKKIDFCWGGYLGISANRFPQIGRIRPSVYYAQAYSGHGLNTSHISGKIVSEAISNQYHRFDVFSKIKHRNFFVGQYLRSPMLFLGMLWYQLKEKLP